MRIRLALLSTFTALTAFSLVAAAPAGAGEGELSYVSAPKNKPPQLIVNRSSRGQAPGYIFMAVFLNKFLEPPLTGQGGPMIVDNKGHYVWLKRATSKAPDTLNLQVQRYRGKPVLTYWDGTVKSTGEMVGTWHVLNNRYREIAKVTSQNGWDPSAHEFIITAKGTAITTGYKYLPNRDLSSSGGAPGQTLLDSGVVEYDLKTGKIVREWSADQHIPIQETQVGTSPQNPNAFDPWHINSIDVDDSGNWLVSMRNTWAVYKVDPKTGQIVWRLGGKASNYAFGPSAAFAFQHDARFRPNGEITLFDNNCCGFIPQPSGPPKPAPPVSQKQSRGLTLKLDDNAKTATVASERKLYDLISGTQGNNQLLSNGNTMIGWGQQPFFSEYSKTGKLLLSVRLPDPDESYRTYRYKWKGKPTGRPAVAARPSGSRTRVYASWNGATEVASYRILAGPTSRRLRVAATAKRSGFETVKTIKSPGPIVRVQALSKRGKVLGTSRAVRRQNTSGNAPAPSY